jgi:signal transduction histidine kinase
MSILAGGKVRVHLNEIDQVYVNGDRDRLKQVFINLVANAIQYTPQGGDVYLSLEQIKGPGACHHSGHRAGHPCRGSASHLRAFLPGREITHARKDHRLWPGPFHRELDC